MKSRFAAKKSRKILLLLVALAAVSAGAAAVVWTQVRVPIRHFAVVQEGVLYRSGQPDDEGLQTIIDRYRIRTVVSLRGAEVKGDWWTREKEFCRRNNLKLVDIAMGPKATVEADLEAFLKVAADPKCQPVLVHCEAGSARTGFAVMGYRVAVQKWSADAALAEAEKFRFNPDVRSNPKYLTIIRALAARQTDNATASNRTMADSGG